MMHVELLLPPSQSEEHLLHFATYIGAKSGWQLGHAENVGYYLRGENAGRWRAVPVFASDAVVRIRQECELERGVPYSLARYVSSIYPFRALASALSEERRAPAHCATLTARVLKNALGYGAPVPQSANWYGPAGRGRPRGGGPGRRGNWAISAPCLFCLVFCCISQETEQ